MTFAYHRSLTPMVGVLLALALIETCACHIVAMAYWGWPVAIPLGLLDLMLFILLGALLRSFRTRPITLSEGVLTLRTGGRMTMAIPVDRIAGLRDHWSAEDLKASHVLNMALLTWPNIVLDLTAPVARRRKAITAIAHCVDDLPGFRDALEQARRS